MSVETLEERVIVPVPEDDALVVGRLDTPAAPSCPRANESRYFGLVVLDGLGGGVDLVSRPEE